MDVGEDAIGGPIQKRFHKEVWILRSAFRWPYGHWERKQKRVVGQVSAEEAGGCKWNCGPREIATRSSPDSHKALANAAGLAKGSHAILIEVLQRDECPSCQSTHGVGKF